MASLGRPLASPGRPFLGLLLPLLVALPQRTHSYVLPPPAAGGRSTCAAGPFCKATAELHRTVPPRCLAHECDNNNNNNNKVPASQDRRSPDARMQSTAEVEAPSTVSAAAEALASSLLAGSSSSSAVTAARLEAQDDDGERQRRVKGHPHSKESRAKISAANKGRTPWNVGKKHSEETRRKIAEGTRRAMLAKAEAQRQERERLRMEEPEKFAQLIADEEAEEAAKQAAKQAKAKARLEAKKLERTRRAAEKAAAASRTKVLNGQSGSDEPGEEATKLTASIRTPGNGRVNFTFSAESRAKISASLKRRWQDPEYRAQRAQNTTRSQEVRQQISETMKLRWADGTYRDRTIGVNGSHSADRRAKISEAIKRKWADPEYRSKATAGIRRSHQNETRRALRRAQGGLSPDARKKISEAMKRRWQEPDFRTVQVQAMRTRPTSPAEEAPRAAAATTSTAPPPVPVPSDTRELAPGDGALPVGGEPEPLVAEPPYAVAPGGSADEAAANDAAMAGPGTSLMMSDSGTEAPESDQGMSPASAEDVEEEDVVIPWGDTIIDFGDELDEPP